MAQHEYVFWIGDLNYKLCQPALGGADAKAAWDFVKRGELDRLLMADELSAQRRNGLVSLFSNTLRSQQRLIILGKIFSSDNSIAHIYLFVFLF